MEMHQVRYFLAVAQTLNFTRAAEQCHVAQPSLTRAIRKLEEELGGLLFHRERQNTHLTDLGRIMHPHLERTYLAAQAARDLARGISSGERAPLRVGLSIMVAPEALTDLFDALRMNVNGIELTLCRGPDRTLCDQAVAGDHDIVVLAERIELPDRMRSWVLFSQTRRLIMPENHRAAMQKSVDITELDGEDIIEILDSGDRDMVLQLRAHAEDPPRFRHRVRGTEELQALVCRGFGLGFLPDGVPVVRGLVARPLACAEFKHAISIAIMAGRPFNRATEACLRLARSRDWGGG
jgi:DNA-binding transcriptional LysR family regulator